MKWWDQSWNPVVGCTKCSPGCTNCYAFQLHMQRYVAVLEGKNVSGKCYEKPFFEIQLLEDRLDIPLRRKIPTVYFVNSMSDLFHKDVPFEFIDKVFAVIWESTCRRQGHTFLILTKRIERMLEYFNSRPWPRVAPIIKLKYGRNWGGGRSAHPEGLWLGVTVCIQAEADKNIPLLLRTPAAHRFLSIEPMLEEVDIKRSLHIGLCARQRSLNISYPKAIQGIDQVILGGETGKDARPMHPDWARKVRDDCKVAGVPFMFKQWGEWGPYDRGIIDSHTLATPKSLDTPMQCFGKKKAGRLLDGVEHNDLAWKGEPK